MSRLILLNSQRRSFKDTDSRGKANWMLRRLEFYGWIEVETDKSDVQRVKFKEYAIKIIKILTEI